MTPFTCPICGARSYNPNDAKHRYCARCHLFVDEPTVKPWDVPLADPPPPPPDFPTNPDGHKSWAVDFAVVPTLTEAFWVVEFFGGTRGPYYATRPPRLFDGGGQDVGLSASIHEALKFPTRKECEAWIVEHRPPSCAAREHMIIPGPTPRPDRGGEADRGRPVRSGRRGAEAMKRRLAATDRPPRRKGETQRRVVGSRTETWIGLPCHLCGALTWCAVGMPGKPECRDCPPPPAS